MYPASATGPPNPDAPSRSMYSMSCTSEYDGDTVAGVTAGRSAIRSPRDVSGIEPHGRAECLPARVPAVHVLRIESGIAQLACRAAGHVKAVGAVHDHRLRFREVTDPLLQSIRIAPLHALGDVLLPGQGMPWPHVDDLDGRFRRDELAHLFDADARHIGELRLDEWSRRRHLCRILVASFHALPVDVAQERVDVRPGIGTEIHVIGVLVHVERENRYATDRGLGVFGRVLVQQQAVTRDVSEHDPSGSATQRIAHRAKLGTPSVE